MISKLHARATDNDFGGPPTSLETNASVGGVVIYHPKNSSRRSKNSNLDSPARVPGCLFVFIFAPVWQDVSPN
jgi:hypothetical protein